jgi:hypothetical protein
MKAVLAIVAVLLFASAGRAAEYFKWVDERGVIHFTDTEASVPAEHRDDVERRRMPGERETSPGSTREATRETEETRDRFGRGKDFWVNWANRARNRLYRAETAFKRLRTEYRQVEDGWKNTTSTADRDRYRKRKEELEVEMRRQREEIRKAREELEIRLPEAAARAGAPAEWVR